MVVDQVTGSSSFVKSVSDIFRFSFHSIIKNNVTCDGNQRVISNRRYSAGFVVRSSFYAGMVSDFLRGFGNTQDWRIVSLGKEQTVSHMVEIPVTS